MKNQRLIKNAECKTRRRMNAFEHDHMTKRQTHNQAATARRNDILGDISVQAQQKVRDFLAIRECGHWDAILGDTNALVAGPR